MLVYENFIKYEKEASLRFTLFIVELDSGFWTQKHRLQYKTMGKF